jgi:SAM-dependent methyltransferase
MNPTTNDSDAPIVEQVRLRYAGAAVRAGATPAADTKAAPEAASCCGPSCCGGDVDAATLARAVGYDDKDLATAGEGNLGLGCGNPLALAAIKPGMTVLDLGSGAGFDAFLAAERVGPTGRVIGVDMTDEMLALARRNAAARGATNVEFRKGRLEALPVEDGTVDLVISNCVLNLVPDKAAAFREIGRVLAPGGTISVSDLVLLAPLPESVRGSVEAYVGCIAGALHIDDYLGAIRAAGFSRVEVISSNSYGEIVTADTDLVARFAAELGTDAASVGRWASAVTSLRVRAVK